MNTDTCLIPLTQGKFATVSACDYDFLMQWKWIAHKQPTSYGYNWYAVRHIARPSRKMARMHREVAKRAGLPDCPRYDHRDKNGLNNSRENLRACTHRQNIINGTKRANATSQYKGVSWHKTHNTWRATIVIDGKQKHLCSSHDELKCALAYDAAARKYFGEFACVNFP